MATMEPPAAAVSAAPYSAIEIRMYAATLPEPTLSCQPGLAAEDEEQGGGEDQA